MASAFHKTLDAYNQGVQSDSDFEIMDRLERLILQHIPQTMPETISILDVIIPSVECGGRGDGADIRALKNIRTFMCDQP